MAGPGAAGALIRLTGAPFALVADAVLLAVSALILRGIRVTEGPRHAAIEFGAALRAGVRFVAGNRLLVTMAAAVGTWQMCHNAALVVQILFATRVLGLSAGGVGLCYIALGVGTITSSIARPPALAPLRPGPDDGARLRDLRRRLVARRDRSGLPAGRGRVRRHADALRRRRDAASSSPSSRCASR